MKPARVCLACVAAWTLLVGFALTGSGLDRLLARETSRPLTFTMIVMGTAAAVCACALLAKLVREDA